jgi:hypothetical protein
MDRTELLAQVSRASSLNQISSVMAVVRAWLADHPQDEEMHDTFQELVRLEREHSVYSRA